MAKELTEEMKEERKAKKAEAKELRNEAKKTVREFFADIDKEQIPEDVLAAIELLTKASTKKPRAAKGPSAASMILTKIKEDGQVSDVDLFMEFKVAQREMAGYIRNWIKKPANVEDRAWVRFDKESEMYILVGEGEYPPENWDGYIPATEEL